MVLSLMVTMISHTLQTGDNIMMDEATRRTREIQLSYIRHLIRQLERLIAEQGEYYDELLMNEIVELKKMENLLVEKLEEK